MIDSGFGKMHVITVNVAHKIMMKVTQVVKRDSLHTEYAMTHSVDVMYQNKMGKLRTHFYAGDNSTSIEWDMQMMLDLKDGWQDFVERKTLEKMKELHDAVRSIG